MNQTTDATSIFSPLWRYKWLILAVGIVVGVGSYFYYKHETPVYRAATQVYLVPEEQATGEKAGNAKALSAAVTDQVAIINAIVVERVRQQLRREHKGALVRGGKVKASAAEKSLFITVTTEGHSAKAAALLANATAQAYIKRQSAAHQRSVERALAISRRQLRRIEAASERPAPKPTSKPNGSTSTSTSSSPPPSTANVLQEASLNSKINQLEASLYVNGAQQIKPAKPATARLLAPTPKRNAIFGFVIGLVLAAIAAYAMARLDRRLRSLPVVERIFGSQLLVGLPKVRRPIVRREEHPAPSRFLLEPLRRLHAAVAHAVNPEHEGQSPSRVILFTSANAGDGKSTIVADLALVQREAGQRVAVVEADFRRPVMARLLGLQAGRGLTEVLAGTVPLEDAMQRVLPSGAVTHADALGPIGGVATAVESGTKGSLFVLVGGGPAVNPPALLASGAITDLLRSLADDFDYVLIDAPSPMEVSDAMPLLSVVDGIVIVARMAHTREVSAHRLTQLLAQSSSAPVIGLVANCVSRAEAQRYGFSSPDGRAGRGWLAGR
jgi:Mrp family chromosome partitioning ATPase